MREGRGLLYNPGCRGAWSCTLRRVQSVRTGPATSCHLVLVLRRVAGVHRHGRAVHVQLTHHAHGPEQLRLAAGVRALRRHGEGGGHGQALQRLQWRLRELAFPKAGPDRFYPESLWPLGSQSGCACALTYVAHPCILHRCAAKAVCTHRLARAALAGAALLPSPPRFAPASLRRRSRPTRMSCRGTRRAERRGARHCQEATTAQGRSSS
jgi:hypothetical protein